MQALLAVCRQLPVDYNTLLEILYAFFNIKPNIF